MYTVRGKLKTSEYDVRFLSKCFYYGWTINNAVVKYAIKHMNHISCNRHYRAVRCKYGRNYSGKDKDELASEQLRDKKELSTIMTAYQKAEGLSKTDFERYAKIMGRKYKDYLSSQQTQKIADQVWKAVESVLFGTGKNIHFKKYHDFDTINQKCATNGVKLKDWDHILFMKHKIEVSFEDNQYINEIQSCGQRVVYCSLKRIEFTSGYQYYVIVTLDGNPPIVKHRQSETGVTGIDYGPSTFAGSSDHHVWLENLAPKSIEYEKQIRHLQRLISHKMKLQNQSNYDEYGRIKKGRHKWVFSHTCKRLRRRIRVLYRKQSAYIRNSHKTLANKVVCVSSVIVAEPMKFGSLQKKSKKTERSDKVSTITDKHGNTKQVRKYKRKKRWGHCVKNHSPGFLQTEMKRKAEKYHIPYLEIDSYQYKASQYHHDTGEYTKAPLTERYKEIGQHIVQRDLYSAYLISHTDEDLIHPDDQACIKDFDRFCQMQDVLLAEMKASHISNKACWGF